MKAFESFHNWLAWNLFFPLQERMKGHQTLSILDGMERADRMSEVDFAELQRAKLTDLIAYSYQHVPFVRERMQRDGIGPEQIREANDLKILPITTKADIRANRAALRSEIASNLGVQTTGGSTGNPLIFDISKRRIASQVACRQRALRWWGLRLGDPEIALWGSPIEARRNDKIRGFRDALFASRLLSAFELNEPTMARYLDILERSGCRQIFAYPSGIHLLCQYSRKHGRNLRNLGIKAVFVTGEVLYPHQRELIQETLDCPVANGYGGRESGFISHECPSGGMHVMADAIIVELLDPSGKPVAPGEQGEIVITDLYSHEFPFIRYATGDLAVASSHRCECGRPLPVIEKIEGRCNDAIVTPDGRVINSLSIVYSLREIDGIEQFRIRQKTTSHFHVQLATTAGFPAGSEARLRTAWSKLLRAKIEVTFEYLPVLPPDPSGKHRHIVSELPGAQIELGAGPVRPPN